MGKHYQESEIEFRREDGASSPAVPQYPVARGLIVHQYGGDIEECIKKARQEFKLGQEWKVVRSDGASV